MRPLCTCLLRLTQVCHDVSQLSGADVPVPILVKHTERLWKNVIKKKLKIPHFNANLIYMKLGIASIASIIDVVEEH